MGIRNIMRRNKVKIKKVIVTSETLQREVRKRLRDVKDYINVMSREYPFLGVELLQDGQTSWQFARKKEDIKDAHVIMSSKKSKENSKSKEK